MASEPKFAHIRIEGGPSSDTVRIYRDGAEVPGVIEWQINGGTEQPVTAIFKELVVFDGQIDIMPRRRGALDS